MLSPDCQVIEQNYQDLMQEALRSALSLLNARDKEIIQARFFSSEPLTLKELSEKFGISVERVRQLEKKALQTLKISLLPLQESL
jgi:RNA polymerase sigma-32 factor